MEVNEDSSKLLPNSRTSVTQIPDHGDTEPLRALVARSRPAHSPNSESMANRRDAETNAVSTRRLEPFPVPKQPAGPLKDLLHFLLGAPEEEASVKIPMSMVKRSEIPIAKPVVDVSMRDTKLMTWSTSKLTADQFLKSTPTPANPETKRLALVLSLEQLLMNKDLNSPGLITHEEILDRFNSKEFGLSPLVIEGFQHFQGTDKFEKFALNLRDAIFTLWKDEGRTKDTVTEMLIPKLQHKPTGMDLKIFDSTIASYATFLQKVADKAHE
ncbi:uncharacterized protein PHALS_09505 [Plasmopara halstedii]|uniref:Uncharacterized protein n=1 Tax=Plasmopara halstedii TaxID=4781 RepID=A0A0P1A4G6_PLAHL|nr:uncharacterized protein PHALS_09505 [Plasmopara halstedii]CEG35382.1 hypothetical protein PHALS_09505 [Plasmopara halstedii]|eukprot:XP_024571751.1 hypothetical protein PHALS_09505 [Plasmopara halstedii]